MAVAGEYLIDGNAVNKLLDTYQLDLRMLPGQVFDVIEKKLIKGLLDQIDQAKPQTVKLVNLEAIQSGPYKDFTYAICGGLVELIESLAAKEITASGTIQDPISLPWNLIAKIDKNFRGVGEIPASTNTS